MLCSKYDTNVSDNRVKKVPSLVLQQAKMNERATVQQIEKEKNRIIDDMGEVLFVQRIYEKERKLEELVEEFEQNEIDTLEYYKQLEREDQEKLKDEHEAIIKKQLQALQADERGKQALTAEIHEIKKKQEKRAEALRARRHALEVEKKRSKRIASLPPPLPQSVKSLLKKPANENVKRYPDITPLVTNFNPILPKEMRLHQTVESENKENILDEGEREKKVQMQEEWNVKARKRYNEALKKDRQKQEYDEILKQIENAERIARRGIARNLSKKEKILPCALPDKLQKLEKQADMEDAVEKVYKKCSKEHAIEDIEGYEDHWERKYKKVDSDFEEKMIDCIPSFVKNNYEYLLKDESKFECGKNFSGIDDSEGSFLNEAFIDVSPQHHEDTLQKSEDIDTVISQLDEMRAELKTTYEEMLRPLLEAELNAPKVELTDKAVETDGMKLSVEDKAVETDAYDDITTPPKVPSYLDTRKIKGYGSIFSSYSEFNKQPGLQQNNVLYVAPTADVGAESWSSSSYYSLPSKHGIPNILDPNDKLSDRNVISCPVTTKGAINKSESSSKNFLISSMVKKLAEKYLEKKSGVASDSEKGFVAKDCHGHQDDLKSSNHVTNKAFEKVKVDKLIFPALQTASLSIPNKPSSEYINEIEKSSSEGPTCNLASAASGNAGVNIQDTASNEMLNKILITKVSSVEVNENASNLSPKDLELKRLELIRQVIFRNISPVSSNQKNKSEKCDKIGLDDEGLALDDVAARNPLQDKNILAAQPYIYHELSTIQEVDSALTDNTPQQSYTDEAFEKSLEKKNLSSKQPGKKHESENSLQEKSLEHMQTVSLLDVPQSEISEFAKNIHFVNQISDKIFQPFSQEFSDTNVERSSDLKEQSIPTSASGTSKIGSKSSTSPSSSLRSTNLHVSSSSENSCDVPLSFNRYKTSSPFVAGTVKDVELAQYFKDVSSIQELKSKSSLQSVSSHSSNMSVVNLKDVPVSYAGYSAADQIDFKNNTEQNRFSHFQYKYAHDESSVGSFKPMTPHSTLTSPNFMQNLKEQQLKYIVSSKDVSRIGRNIVENYCPSDSSGSFQQMTPHSDISMPENPKFHEGSLLVRNIDTERGAGTFKPLSPVSKLSSEKRSQEEKNIRNWNTWATSSAGSFKPLSPDSKLSFLTIFSNQSDLDIPKNFPLKDSTILNFNQSSKNSRVQEDKNLKNWNAGEASSESSKPLSPDSKFSFPSYIRSQLDTDIPQSLFSKDDDVLNSATNSDGSNFLNMRLNILTPDSMEYFRNYKISDFEQSHLPYTKSKIDRQVTIKTKSVSKPLNCLSFPEEGSLSIHNDMLELGQIPRDKFCQEIMCNKTKQASGKTVSNKVKVHSNSSGFFIPHLNKSDFVTAGKKGNNNVMMEGSLHNKFSMDYPQPGACDSNPVLSDNTSFVSGSDIEILRSDVPTRYEVPGDLYLEEISLIKDYENVEKKLLTTAAYFINVPQVQQGDGPKNNGNDMERGLYLSGHSKFLDLPEKQICISKESQETFTNLLKAIPSNSSDGHLSEISGSKVVSQSTPIKSIEQIMQETGIMEEPDLTLITSEFSCRALSPEKSRRDLNNYYEDSIQVIKNEEKASSMSPQIQIDYSPSTPDNLGQVFTAETPSMLSFLQHEMSCLQKSKEEQNLHEASKRDSDELHSVLLEKKKQNLTSRFKHDYKKRTKRLWNNLEEVRRKNLDAERKKCLALNRIKAKEFAKKLGTPKKN